MLDMVEREERPMYRDKSFQRVERWKNKMTKKMMWSKAKSVIFIPLSQKLKEEALTGIRRAREDIKVVERGGISLKRMLQKSDPAKESLCKDPNCWI